MSSVFLTALTLSLLFQSFSAAPPHNLDFLCRNLQGAYIRYNECLDFFQRDPRSQTATFQELAVIAIDVVIANSTSIQAEIGMLLKNERNPSANFFLQSCAKDYSDGVPTLRQAKDDSAAKKFAGASDALQTYVGYPQNCLNEYSGLKKKGIVNSVGNESGALIDLTYIAKSTNHFVQGK